MRLRQQQCFITSVLAGCLRSHTSCASTHDIIKSKMLLWFDCRSAEYNFGVQLNTLRWAMIDQLRHPPPGFEVRASPWHCFQESSRR